MPERKQERIFVTGASGMVGYQVVRYLANQGYEVLASVRATSKTEALQSLPGAITIIKSDLHDQNNLVPSLAGCSAVVHCAGAVDPHARRQDIIHTNVDGTASLLQAAIAAKLSQFIHISSLSVITGQNDQYDVNESAPLTYCGEAYADSKVDAEKAVLQKATSINITILRPGFIYGPGEHAWMPRLINSLAGGKAMLIDGGTKQTNVIYIENLCQAVALSLLNPDAYGQTYNLTDEITPNKKQLFAAICQGLNLPPVTKVVPGFAAKAVCNIVSSIAPLLPTDSRAKLSRFSRAAFRLAGVNQGFDISKAQRELGYTNTIPFERGMADTLKSFRNNAAGKERINALS